MTPTRTARRTRYGTAVEARSGRSGLDAAGFGAGLLVLVFVGQANVAAFSAANWDEYHYLWQVHESLRGTLPSVLQTWHTRLFFWLPRVAGNETDQILVARAVLLVLHAGTCCFVYRIAARFTGSLAALFATLSYASFSFTLLHGASFRPDPIATFLLSGALERLTTPRESLANVLLAALLSALAAAITIKSAVYAPFIVASILLGASPMRGNVVRLAFYSGVSVVVFAVLIAVHGIGTSAERQAGELIVDSVATTLLSGVAFGRWFTLLIAVSSNAAFWIPLFVGFRGAMVGALGRGDDPHRRKRRRIVAFALPVLFLLIYRNSFPYFYPFLLAPVSLVVAAGWERLMRERARVSWYPLLALLVGVNVVLHGILKPHLGVTLADQRRLLDEVHRLFPNEVAYIDRCSMVSGYPKVGFFMSTWGQERYLAGEGPIFGDILDSRQPKFILANTESLYVGEEFGKLRESSDFSLLEADLDVLQQNFIHHWGPLFVAGKRFDLSADPARQDFLIRIGGSYTLESEGQVVLDGVPRGSSSIVDLAQGLHSIGMLERAGTVTLRYGHELPVPDWTFDHVVPFNGFN